MRAKLPVEEVAGSSGTNSWPAGAWEGEGRTPGGSLRTSKDTSTLTVRPPSSSCAQDTTYIRHQGHVAPSLCVNYQLLKKGHMPSLQQAIVAEQHCARSQGVTTQNNAGHHLLPKMLC